MKIGITCYPTYGGSGAVATELGLSLADRGHEVHFVSYAMPFRLNGFHERVFFHEVEMEEYPLFEHPPYSLALAVAIHGVAREAELDLMHVHYAIPHATSAWVARRMLAEEGHTLPIVTTLHGTDITLVGIHPSFQPITRFSIRHSHGLTAVSEYLAGQTHEDFDVPREDIEVIPNFIDPERYYPGREPCHRDALAPGGQKIVMHISNFRSVKRIPDVVMTFARIRDSVDSRLVLVGDGPERPRAREIAERLGVADDVVFLGKHAAVEELLHCADLFLLPSESESFGLAALEAMACGVPVVTSDAGGLPEVVIEGEVGHLLPVGDFEGMADAGVAILSDPKEHRRYSENARAHAVERYSVERVVPMYESHYQRILTSKGE